eukprot:gene13125-17592_t
MEEEEPIDFADPNFILKNLNLVNPKYEDDPTFLLSGRQEVIRIICHQISFYCYCALYALQNQRHLYAPINILVIGDGFVGTNLISELVDYGAASILRIYSRSDLQSADWRRKGLISDHILHNLMKGVHADIVISNTDYASFSSLVKLLAPFVNDNTFFITSSFGFQRMKILTNLHTPNVFRTYTESYQILKKIKKKVLSKAKVLLSNQFENPLELLGGQLDDNKFMFKERLSPSSRRLKGVLSYDANAIDDDDGIDLIRSITNENIPTRDIGISSEIVFNDELSSSIEHNYSLGQSLNEFNFNSSIQISVDLNVGSVHNDSSYVSVVQKTPTNRKKYNGILSAANILAKRTVQISNLIYLVENFAFIRGCSRLASRKLALKCIIGYDWVAERNQETDSYVLSNEPIHPNDENMNEEEDSEHHFKNMILKKNNPNFSEERFRGILDPIVRSIRKNIGRIFQNELSSNITIGEIYSLSNEFITAERKRIDEIIKNKHDINFAHQPHDMHEIRKKQLMRLNTFHSGNSSQHSGHSETKRALYNEQFIMKIFNFDSNYSNFEGPGIDLIKRFDVDIDENSIESEGISTVGGSGKSKLRTNQNATKIVFESKKVPTYKPGIAKSDDHNSMESIVVARDYIDDLLKYKDGSRPPPKPKTELPPTKQAISPNAKLIRAKSGVASKPKNEAKTVSRKTLPIPK